MIIGLLILDFPRFFPILCSQFEVDMRYRYVHFLAAAFLLVGMGIQFVVSYRQARHHVQEKIDLEMKLAQEKLRFELYDAYNAVDQLKESVEDNLSEPEELLEETYSLLKHYTNIYSCYASFPEYFYPQNGKWFCPCSYRLGDKIFTVRFGDKDHDYFTREWYKGAVESGGKGYWSQPYVDEDFDETIFTYSDDMVDDDGNLLCVVAVDFSISWMHRLLEQFKPFEESVMLLYSSNGTLLTSSDQADIPSQARLGDDRWILSRQTIAPIDIDIVIVVPQRYIWKGIRLGILLPFFIFLLGILVVGLLLRHLWVGQKEKARLETEKKVMEHELEIAHGIQMGILRKGFPKDDKVEVYADLLPMREVGGDFYDYQRIGDDLWFVIGDVSGKGVPAAIIMSATVNLFRSALGHQSSPKAIMEEMNAVLSDNNPSLTFVTAFIGKLDIPGGQLLFCNAGHCKPILRNGTCLPVKANIPLGFDGEYEYVEESCKLEAGETLVLYTDGVTEARNSERKMMGMDYWSLIVARGGDLLKAVQGYIGKTEPTDDITLMTIHIKK